MIKNPIIIASRNDLAGMNIVENLKKLGCKTKIEIIEGDLITAENIDKKYQTDFIIFASRHKSEKETKTLSVHSIGNFNDAKFGGKPGTLCLSNALINKVFFKKLNEIAKKENSDYELTMEATHHGPCIETPSLFIEIGSTEKQWKDKKAGKIIAETIINSVNEKLEDCKIAFGIGGPHYCPSFNKIQLGDKIAISHVISAYSFPLTDKIIEETVSKTKEKVDFVLLDWKGLGNAESRNNILDILKKFNLKILKTKDLH